MELVFGETRWVTGVSPAHGGSGDPSPVTAYGTLQGIKAAVKWRYSAPDLKGRTVAIQGLGAVGNHLAGYLVQEGAKVFGSDIDRERTEQARQLGVEIVPNEQILELECDIFAPCALGAILDDETIPRLRCQIVAGAANNQLADEATHGAMLDKRGILYAPDFVINAGGLINVYNELLGGYNRERALRMTRGIYLNLTRVFETSKREGISTALAAGRVAEDRIATVQKLRAKHWGRLLVR
jgi:leucine dehydrogenase